MYPWPWSTDAAMQKNDQRHTTDDDLSHLARIVLFYFIWNLHLPCAGLTVLRNRRTCTFLLPQICRDRETTAGAQL
jgi:hypothetical protein